MKKLFTAAILAVFALTACNKGGDEPPVPGLHTVTMTTVGGGEATAKSTDKAGIVGPAAKIEAIEDCEVTLTAEPWDGCWFWRWEILNIAGDWEHYNGYNPTTFIMPGCDVSVRAVFEGMPPPEVGEII